MNNDSYTDSIKEESRSLSEYTFEDYQKDFELDYLGFDGVPDLQGKSNDEGRTESHMEK